MVFLENREEKKISAKVMNGGLVENYDCSFSTCENPVCTCGTMTMDFSSLQDQGLSDRQVSSHCIMIDVIEKKAAFLDPEKVSKENLAFADLVLSQLEEDDFQLLSSLHFAYKNIITENARLETIDAWFDYTEIEKNGLMSAYNDVLPYGDQMQIVVGGKDYAVFDQYCLLPGCPCTNVTLSLLTFDRGKKVEQEAYTVEVNYKKKKWKTLEGRSFDISVKDVHNAIEEQVPNFYKRLLKRHLKLKGIYAHCKRKHFAPATPLELPQVGRNEPCPCGSGKKYKKCCMIKST